MLNVVQCCTLFVIWSENKIFVWVDRTLVIDISNYTMILYWGYNIIIIIRLKERSGVSAYWNWYNLKIRTSLWNVIVWTYFSWTTWQFPFKVTLYHHSLTTAPPLWNGCYFHFRRSMITFHDFILFFIDFNKIGPKYCKRCYPFIFVLSLFSILIIISYAIYIVYSSTVFSQSSSLWGSRCALSHRLFHREIFT